MITLKKWSGTAWVEESPKVGIDTIVASGTPSASTYLRGDGSWATPPNTNNYPTSLSFNSTNGVLTLGRNGLTDLTVDLDGKYAEKTNSNYYVEGNSGGTAGTWTGTISDITALYTGLSIDYKINTAGASTTTLNINSYGAKTVRRNTSNLTTHLPVGTVVHLVYDGTYWVWADYDQGADQNVMFINNVIFGEATQGYHLLMEGINGKMYPVTSGGNAGSTTNTITSAELKVGGSMVYYGSSTDYVANAVGGAYSLFTATFSGEMEYWSNKSTGWATAGLPFYIVGSINANGNLVLDGAGTTGNAFITQTLPTSDNGKVYIQVGFMRNTYDEWTLVSEHPMYIYKNGQLRLYGGEYIDYAADADTLDGKHASEFATSGHVHMPSSITTNADRILGRIGGGTGGATELTAANIQSFLGLGSAAYSATSAYRASSWVPAWSDVTSKPTTLSGYGITDALASSLKGAVNGIAELDSTGKVPSTQLPSYVDDVLEYANLAGFPTTGDTGKIYVALDTNITYRWSGTAYVEISASLALGETSATAYRGDRGKTAYDHSQVTTGAVHGATTVGNSFFRLTNPSAITFPRINADNSVSALDATSFRTAIGAGTSSTTGTVTSVGLSMPTGFTVTNSPVTTSGTLTVALTAGYELLTTGTQTISGTKTFSSTITGSISGNAGSVTNGVYTVGDQSIGGVKTFTSDVTIDTTPGGLVWNSKNLIFKYNQGNLGGGILEKPLYVDSGGTLRFDGTALSLSGHTHTFASLTSIPTTLSGYGITDAVPNTRTIAGSALSSDISRDTVIGVSTNGFVKRTGANTYAIDTNTYLTGINSSMVTTALGYTPYNSTNPNGYITSSGSISGNAATATKLAAPVNINGVSFDGSASITVYDGSKLPLSGGTLQDDLILAKDGSTEVGSHGIVFQANTAGSDFLRELNIDKTGALKFNGANISLDGHTHTYADLTGTVPIWNQSTTGNAATATTALYANQWTSAIALTIGASSQFLDGTTGLSYSLASIGAAPSSHSHGDISSGGLISTETSMGTGDAILLADSSASGKVIKSNLTLDTTNTTQYLRRDGAWVTPPTASHTHGDISNTGTITSTAVTPASGDYILISDTSASGIIKRAIALGSSTTTFLRNDGTWQTGTGAVQSVNGLTGALNTQSLITANTTVNSVTYGRTYGIAQQTSGGSKLRIASGFYAPSATSSGNVISFGTTFTNAPMVVAFCLKAGSTTATVIGAKVTAVSATGCTIISSWAGASSTGYTPAAETYGWIAIGY